MIHSQSILLLWLLLRRHGGRTDGLALPSRTVYSNGTRFLTLEPWNNKTQTEPQHEKEVPTTLQPILRKQWH